MAAKSEVSTGAGHVYVRWMPHRFCHEVAFERDVWYGMVDVCDGYLAAEASVNASLISCFKWYNNNMNSRLAFGV